jgi:allantoinase
MTDFDLVLTGRVVRATRVIEKGFVAVRGETIELVGEGEPPAARERHDLGEALILPGAIDSQVHSRSQKDQEDFIWSTRSAAAGGVTTIVDMPYDDGDLICDAEKLTRKAEEAGAQARVDFGLYGTVHPQAGAAEIAGMVKAGAVGFKFSTFGTHPERFPRITPYVLNECFTEIAKHGLIAGIHNENDEFVRTAVAKVESSGIRDYRAHGLSRPAIAEALAMAEVYEIGAATGCSTHVVHCSISRGYDLCDGYRRQGYDATVEACIHYLTLDEETDVARLGGFAKINPPVRSRDQVEALWRHLAAGRITVVSTDHVSWSRSRKSDPEMLANSSGVPGLEAMYPLLLKGLFERELSFSHAARLLAANPARLFRVGFQKGALEIGRDADIAVFAPSAYTYSAAESGNNVVDWSPYDGIRMPYRAEATFLRGKMAFDGRKVISAPGSGNLVRPL